MSECEHEQLTPWGYTIDAETLPDLLTVDEFNASTGNKFQGDVRIPANIPSASQAIRNYCGWHVSPSLECGMLYRIQDIRDAFIGSDLLIQLPATFVTSVSKIIIGAKWDETIQDWDGEIITDPEEFDLSTNGVLRVYDVGVRGRKSRIFIRFTAGFPDTAIPSIKEVATDLVSHAVANPYGVNSEAAGGVSVSYSSTWANQAGSASLASNTREVLNAYKARRVY